MKNFIFLLICLFSFASYSFISPDNPDFEKLSKKGKEQANEMAEKICGCAKDNKEALEKFYNDIEGLTEAKEIFPKMMKDVKDFMMCHAEYEKMTYDDSFQAEWKKIAGEDRLEATNRLTEVMVELTAKNCEKDAVLYKKFTDVLKKMMAKK